MNISLPTLLRMKGMEMAADFIFQPKEIAYASAPSCSLPAAGGRVALIDVFLDALIEDPVSLQDEIDGVTAGSLAAGIRRDVVGHAAFTWSRALATAMANPHTRITGRSITSSPT